MRRLALALVVTLAAALVGCGGQARPHLWLTPGHAKRVYSACGSSDCGPWSVTLNWTIPSIPNQTGYWMFLNGTQVGQVTTGPFTFYGWDCGWTSTLGVEAHDAAGNHGQLWTTSYTAPACGGAPPANTAEPIATGTVATGDVVSTTNGSWSNTPTSYSYQWQRCPTDGTACSDIAGATSQTYTVQSADSGDVLRANVTAWNAGGSSSPQSSPMIPFGDVFNGSTVDTNVWKVLHEHGDTTQSEPECYEPAQTTVSANTLIETPIHVGDSACPLGPGQPTTTSTYESGNVQAQTFNYRYGTLKAKIAYAGGTQTWSSIWELASDQCQSPSNLSTCAGAGPEEIDISEVYSGDQTYIGHGVYHGAWTDCEANSTCPAGTPTAANIYELDWTPTSEVFKINGTQVDSYSFSLTEPHFPIIDSALETTGTITGTTKVYWVYVTTDSPDPTAAPTLSGTFKSGNTVTVSNGTWAGGQSCGSGLTCTYEFHTCDPSHAGSGYCSVAQSASSSNTYTLQASDVGHYIQGVVIATNADGGAASSSSAQSTAVS